MWNFFDRATFLKNTLSQKLSIGQRVRPSHLKTFSAGTKRFANFLFVLSLSVWICWHYETFSKANSYEFFPNKIGFSVFPLEEKAVSSLVDTFWVILIFTKVFLSTFRKLRFFNLERLADFGRLRPVIFFFRKVLTKLSSSLVSFRCEPVEAHYKNVSILHLSQLQTRIGDQCYTTFDSATFDLKREKFSGTFRPYNLPFRFILSSFPKLQIAKVADRNEDPFPQRNVEASLWVLASTRHHVCI